VTPGAVVAGAEVVGGLEVTGDVPVGDGLTEAGVVVPVGAREVAGEVAPPQATRNVRTRARVTINR